MTGTNCDLFTHNQSRSYLNHLVITFYFCTYGNVKMPDTDNVEARLMTET
jgi:hypothetical protein